MYVYIYRGRSRRGVICMYIYVYIYIYIYTYIYTNAATDADTGTEMSQIRMNESYCHVESCHK